MASLGNILSSEHLINIACTLTRERRKKKACKYTEQERKRAFFVDKEAKKFKPYNSKY